MGRTKIEWATDVWNPIRGCSRVSAGCQRCYAERMASRFNGPGQPYEGLAENGRWTGVVRLVPEALGQPLRWRKPRRIFVNSMSDLFHESLDFDAILTVFGIMINAPQHVFQVLTKRPRRMREFLRWRDDLWTREYGKPFSFPPHVWLGVSVENQATADERIPELLQTPAAVRFISYEPALGPLNVARWLPWRPPAMEPDEDPRVVGYPPPPAPLIHWLIAGGESGPGARPCELDWFRSVRDACRMWSVPLFVKQLPGSGGRVLTKIGDFPEDLRIQEYPEVVP